MSIEDPLVINAITIFILLLPPVRANSSASKSIAWFKLMMFLSVWIVFPKLGLLSILTDFGVSFGLLSALNFGAKFGEVDLLVLVLPNALILFGAISAICQVLKGNGHRRTP